MRTSPAAVHRRFIPSVALAAVFFGLVYAHVRLRIDPRLVYHKQTPIFMVGSGFFRTFLDHPGGLLEYACAFQ